MGVQVDRKPNSVPPSGHPKGGGDHSSGTAVAGRLKRRYPRTSGGPPSSVLLFGLAPDGVYQAFPVTQETGELLPHLFTLTHRGHHRRVQNSKLTETRRFQTRIPACSRWAVSFLWHFPWGHPQSPLATILPCGARTFLRPTPSGPAIISSTPTSKSVQLKTSFVFVYCLVGQLVGQLVLVPSDMKNPVIPDGGEKIFHFLKIFG